MANVGSANVQITAEDRQARQKVGGFVGFLKGAGKTAAGVMGGVALFSGVVSAIGSVVTAGPSYEAAMSKVKAVTRATDEQMVQMDAQAKQLGKTTKFSASEAADAMGFLGMAGFDTNQIMSAMPSVLDLAASGNLDLGRAADIASNILSGFNMKAEDTAKVSDIIALSAASANTSVEQMGYAMSYVAPIASSAGLSLEETAGAIGILSNAGIQGERAGTALRGIIAKLQSPTKATKNALKEMGLTIDDVNPSTKSLTEILGALEGAGITSAQAMDLVGVEAGPGLLAMISQGSEGLKQMTTDLENSAGAGKEMARTMSDNVAGNWKTFLSAMESISLALFTLVKPAINEVLTALTALARGFSAYLEPNISRIQGIIGPVVQRLGEIVQAILQWKPLVPIVTGLGTAFVTLMIANKVAVGVGLLRGAILILANPISRAVLFTNLWRKAQLLLNATLLANPIGLVIAILAGFGAALVVAYNKSETFRTIVNNAWQQIKIGFQSFLNFFTTTLPAWYQSVVTWFTNMKTATVSRITQMVTAVITWWNNLKAQTVAIIQGMITAVIGFFVSLGTRIRAIIQPLVNFFRSTFQNIKLLVLGIATSLISILTGDFQGLKLGLTAIITALKNQVVLIFNALKSGVVNTARALWNIVKSLFNGGRSALISIGNAIKSGVSNSFNALRSAAIDYMTRMAAGIIRNFNNMKSKASTAISNMKSTVSNGFNSAKKAGTDAIKGLYDGVRTWLSNVVKKFREMKSDIMGTVKGINLFDIGKNIVTGLVNGLSSKLKDVKAKAKEIAENVKKATADALKLKSPSRVMIDMGKNVGQGLINGMAAMGRKTFKTAAKMGSHAKNGVASALKIASPSKVLFEQGKNSIEGFLNGMTSLYQKVKDKTKAIAQAAVPNPDGNGWSDYIQSAMQSLGDNPVGKYVRAVMQDGDYMNDWLEQMSGATRSKVLGIGKQLSQYQGLGGDTHNHQWNVQAEDINDVQKLIAMINRINQTVKGR